MGVDVADLPVGSTRMSASADDLHRAGPGLWPVGSGSVMWAASADIPCRRAARRRSLRSRAPAPCPSSSSTRSPRPLRPITSSTSRGRRRTASDARFGSSLRRESARIASKPATPTCVDRRLAPARDHRVDSGPSGSRPSRLPIATMFVEAAHGGALAHQRPLVPSSIETHPAPMLGMRSSGIENGLYAVGAAMKEDVVAVLERLEAADAGRDRGADPLGVGGDIDPGSPAPPGARPPSGPSARKRSIRLADQVVDPRRRLENPSARRRSERGSRCGRKSVDLLRAALCRASRRAQVVSTSFPSAVTIPIPVMTTRRLSFPLSPITSPVRRPRAAPRP